MQGGTTDTVCDEGLNAMNGDANEWNLLVILAELVQGSLGVGDTARTKEVPPGPEVL